jgi:hypothetical protein
MTLEKQCVSLDLARKLKELIGVKEDSMFYWVKHRQTAWPDPQLWFTGQVHDWNNEQPEAFKIDILYSAFTVAELGEIIYKKEKVIPPRYDIDTQRWQFELVHIETPIDGKTSGLMFTDNEADARAEQLIFLIKHNQIIL